MWFLNVLLVVAFFLVLFQDYKDRLVYWYLYPAIGILSFLIQIGNNTLIISTINSFINLLFICTILLVCFIYARLKLKKHFLNNVFGLGDILFFLFICFTFSSISFFILFAFSLFFSLLLHLALGHKNKDKTVPLAGYMSLFFGVVYIISFLCECSFLYTY